MRFKYCRRYWLLTAKNEMANHGSGLSDVNTHRSGSTAISFSGRSLFSNMSFGKRKPFLNIRSVAVHISVIVFISYVELVILFDHRAPVESMETSGSTNPTAMIVGGSKGFEDPSEPIYTDPSLFERSRSLRSIAFSSSGQNVFKNEAFCH